MTRRNPEKKVDIDLSGDVVIPKVQDKKPKRKTNENKNSEGKKDMQCDVTTVLTVEDLRQKLIDTACFMLDKVKNNHVNNASELLDISLRIYHDINAFDVKDDIKDVINKSEQE